MIIAIPLALLQLIHYRIRFLATLGGITFVVVLLFIQLGFQDALYTSSVRLHQSLKGDLFVVSGQYKSLTSLQSFPRTRLYQALAVEEVDSVSPLYVQFAKSKNIQTGQKFPIFVLGIDPGNSPFKLPDITENLNQIKNPQVALFDRDARPEFGPIAEEFLQGRPVSVEISTYNEIVDASRLEIGGLFGIGPSFGVDGSLVVNYSAWLQIFTENPADEIFIGVVILKPDADLQAVLAKLKNQLPQDVQILNSNDFIDLEKRYWSLRTPIGFIFKIMVTMGFLIGIGVTYQILYTNISTHLVAYATLKAIGHTNFYLSQIVLQQSLLLSILGYIPGYTISYGVFTIAQNATNLPIVMTPDKMFIVFASLLLMCYVSGFLAMQRLSQADPAEIF